MNSRAFGQLIFRDQSHAQKKGVAGVMLLCAGDRIAVFVHLRKSDARKAILALDIDKREFP